jgi:hypothetical protein
MTWALAAAHTVEGSNDCKSAGIAFGGSNPPRPTETLLGISNRSRRFAGGPRLIRCLA